MDDVLEELARSLEDSERIQWEEIDDVLMELGVTQGDFPTNILAVIWMVAKWYKDNNKTTPLYRTLRKKLKERFKIIGSGIIKTSSREAWDIWKTNQKEIRRAVAGYKKRTKIREQQLQKLQAKRKRQWRQARKRQEERRDSQD